MNQRLSILYRGPLASCDYDCAYCPFAKRRDGADQLNADRAALARFVDWALEAKDLELSILFTPWGEALVRPWYRDALVALSHPPHIRRVAIQTNLSMNVAPFAAADRQTLALWCTYHPTETRLERFLARVAELEDLGIRHSVGIVGLPEHLDQAERLRDALPPATYLWVNAAEGLSYDDDAVAAWAAIDPLFAYSAQPHASLGRTCRTGSEVITVRGDGGATRCHFVDEPIGNLYDGTLRLDPSPTACPNRMCDCHIGYVHLEDLRLDQVFGAGILERVPLGRRATSSAVVRDLLAAGKDVPQ